MKKITDVSPLEAHIGYWMRLVSNHVSHSFSLKLEAHGVTVAEWVVMRELWEVGEVAPSVLADNLGLTRGAISKLIERLVNKELVNRTFSQEDRRFQKTALSPSGRALLPRLAELADQNDAQFFNHLDEHQKNDLIDLLRDVVQRQQIKGAPVD
ncbi:hypothetical protein IAD21_02170 [Abditibacteriota bacterium]|nr:hypothetical protein IAD21_02170 [Abditibacteriota bacterium]